MTIVQTATFDSFIASGTRPATFNRFDTVGGTREITGVNVSFFFDKTGGSYAIDNDSVLGGEITFSHNLRGRLVPGSGSGVSVGTAANYVNAESVFTTEVEGDDGDPDEQFNVGGPDYVIYFPDPILNTGHSATILPAFRAAYTAPSPSTFVIIFQANQLFGVDGVGGLQSQTISSMAKPTIIVTYSYIPEPSTALLGGLGLLALLRRRR